MKIAAIDKLHILRHVTTKVFQSVQVLRNRTVVVIGVFDQRETAVRQVKAPSVLLRGKRSPPAPRTLRSAPLPVQLVTGHLLFAEKTRIVRSHSRLMNNMSKRWVRRIGALLTIIAGVGLLGVTGWSHYNYQVAPEMVVPVREFSTGEYPENPADLAPEFGRYTGRSLRLVQLDETHFDFALESADPGIATITWPGVDASLFVATRPDWTANHPGNQIIALVDREWNRQQVSFSPSNNRVKVTGGDGWERAILFTAEIANNCLNAGLWEILLFKSTQGGKQLYYQGWFTFPLGHYRRLVEHNTGLRYADHWFRLEHWWSPEGIEMSLNGLRRVLREDGVSICRDTENSVVAAGEQARKVRTIQAGNARQYADYFDGRPVTFGSFVKPGHYDNRQPHGNEFWRLRTFLNATWRKIESPAQTGERDELELRFRDAHTGTTNRFLVGGFNARELPQLPSASNSAGLYMPMGIAVPPFFQSIEKLEQQPLSQSTYYSVLLDDGNRWLDHHRIGIDGPVMHRDQTDPDLLHVYLLSYERHALVAHFTAKITGDPNVHP